MRRDLYRILGVKPTDSVDDIRAAYRRLARQLHPDVNSNPADHQRFAEVAEAYRVLSDPRARKSYDARRLLRALPPVDRLVSLAEDPATRARVVSRIAHGLRRLNELGQRAGRIDGHDLSLSWDITFAESYSGTELRFTHAKPSRCKECNGTGLRAPTPCPACAGAGRLAIRTVPGLTKRCPRCNGRGVAGEGRCEPCRGEGLVQTQATTSVRVPAGVASGTRLRLKGQGVPGRFGGRDGDLLVRLNVEGSLTYGREGHDLIVEREVDLAIALDGGVLPVELPDGRTLEVRAPGGLYPGQHLGVAGQGFPVPSDRGRGDLFVVIDVRLPAALAAESRNLAMQWLQEARAAQGHPSPALTAAVRRAVGGAA